MARPCVKKSVDGTAAPAPLPSVRPLVPGQPDLWAAGGLLLTCGGASGYSDLGRELAVDVRAGQADGNVIAVHLGGAEYLDCDLPLSGWHDSAASGEENSLAYHFYTAWRAANPEVGDLRFDQAIGYKHPLFLRSADEAENLEVSDRDVYFSLWTQTATQLR